VYWPKFDPKDYARLGFDPQQTIMALVQGRRIDAGSGCAAVWL